MGYLQVLNLMVKAYKAARGVMPKGLDLLKLQQRARKKVIDSNKVVQFPKDRITNPFKPRPTKPEGTIPVTVKGKTSKMSPEGIMNMLMKQGKGKDVKIGQAPKTTKVKEAVDPKLVMQESTRELYKKLTRQNREAIRNFKKRNKDDPTKKAYGGRVNFNTGGGISNVIGTYLSNPTLQDRYTQQQYEDLFGVGTAHPQTVSSLLQNQVQPTRVAAAPVVPPIIKPIIPQGDGDGGGGGITTVDLGEITADNYGFGVADQTGMTQLTEQDLKDIDDARFSSALKGIGYDLKNFLSKTLVGRLFSKGKEFALQNRARIEEEKRIKEEQIAAAAELARRGTGAYITQDSFGGDYGQRAGGGSFSGRGASTDITAETGSS